MGQVEGKESKAITFLFPHIHHDGNWDIRNSTSLWSYFISSNLVEPLIRLGPQTQYQPALATSWIFSQDRKTLSLQLSDKFSYHDGKAITAEDVLKSLVWSLLVEGNSHSDLAEAFCSDGKCPGVKLTKKGVLTLESKYPVNGLLFNLASPEFSVVPSTISSKKKMSRSDLGVLSGPYRVESFDREKMILKAHDHPLVTKDSPAQAEIREIVKIEEAVKYAEKNPHAVAVASDYKSGLLVKSSKKLISYYSDFTLTEFFVPNTKSTSLNTLEKREAFQKALRLAKAKASYDENLGELTDQLFTKNSLARIRDYKPGGTDRSNSRASGSDKRNKKLDVILFDWMEGAPILEEVARELLRQGYKLNVSVYSIGEGLKKVSKGEFDLIYIYSGVSAPDPIIEFIYLFDHPLVTHAITKDLRETLNAAKAEPNQDKYAEIVRSIHQGLLDRFLIYPVIHTRMVYGSGGSYQLNQINHFDGGLDLWKWTRRK